MAQRKTPESKPSEPFAAPKESGRIPDPEADSSTRPSTAFARVMRQAGPYMTASWMMTAAIVLGALGGRWLDIRYGTQPWLLLTGLTLGLTVGTYELMRAVREAAARSQDDPDQEP